MKLFFYYESARRQRVFGPQLPRWKPTTGAPFISEILVNYGPQLPSTASGVRLEGIGMPACAAAVCSLCSVTACLKPISKANLAILPSSKRKTGHKKKTQTHTPAERD